MNELLCKLSEFEFIKIITKNNINFDKADFCCDEIEAYFIDNKNQNVIPHDVAIQWLEQLMKVYRMFFSTEENYQKACKRLNW